MHSVGMGAVKKIKISILYQKKKKRQEKKKRRRKKKQRKESDSVTLEQAMTLPLR